MGKWNKNKYSIVKELGRGANGVVYLAKRDNQNTAVKISEDYVTITSEVNVLKSLSEAQGTGISLGPSLLDTDDFLLGQKKLSFYAMEYIEGFGLLDFIKRKGIAWLDVLILQLLKDLDILHNKGWVFGDLKPDNLIVTGTPVQIRCIDVGGTTQKGRAIKEFTEFFDRGYWEMGTRKAEPAYDLFAVAMIIINVYYPGKFSKREGGLKQLDRMIMGHPGLKKYHPVLYKALTGRYTKAKEMRRDLFLLLSAGKKQNPVITPQRIMRRNNKGKGLAETLLIILFFCFVYFFYLYSQTI